VIQHNGAGAGGTLIKRNNILLFSHNECPLTFIIG